MRTALNPTPVVAGLLVVALVLVAGACAADPAGAGDPAPSAGEVEPSTSAAEPAVLELSSPDLDGDGRLPEWATATVMSFCAGENRSPRLEWTGVPEGVESFALTLVDATEPEFVHWVVTGIDAETRAVESTPAGTISEGVVGWNFLSPGAYRGPCVEDHTYTFTLYALGIELVGSAHTTREDLLGWIEGHVLASASLDVRRAAG